MIQDQWEHVAIRGTTDYGLVSLDARVAIRAQVQHSASGLIRRVEVDTARCPVLEWSWRVDVLQESADIRVKERDDVAASLFLFFGEIEMFPSPTPVPTLRYVWTTAVVPVETIVANPYVPAVRNVVVEAGPERLGHWLVERRNVAEDYERAFGHRPRERLMMVGVFTDSDQTREPAQAYYEWARMLCLSPGTSGQ